MCVCALTYMSVSVFTHIRVFVRVCTDCMAVVELQVHINKSRVESSCTKTCKTNRKDCFLVKKNKISKKFLEIFAQKLDSASKKRSNMPVYLIWSVKHTRSAQKEKPFLSVCIYFRNMSLAVYRSSRHCYFSWCRLCYGFSAGMFVGRVICIRFGGGVERVTSRVHQRRDVVIKVV